MALLDGKQLRNGSTSLDKLQGHSGLVTFTASATMSFEDGAVLRRETADILIATDVVNKEYVDSVAAGLDPKESVKVIAATGPITLAGVGQVIDGYTIVAGDRILVNSQAGPTVATISNGIYSATAGTWSRAADSDGTPSNEVSFGNFAFVEEGSTYGGSGWVLSISDSPDSPIDVTTETQLWVQFSAAGYYTAGDGLTLTGSEFSVNTGTGLTISGNNVAIANTGVTAGTYGDANTVPTFTVDSKGQLTFADQVDINITSSQVSDFATAVNNEVFDSGNFVDGTTIDFTVTAGTSVTAEVTTGSLTASKFNTNGQGATAGYILSVNSDGTFAWIVNDAGDITEVTAGAGLTGGGTTGAVTLDVQTTNGVSIIGDSVGLGGTLTQNTTINAATNDFIIGDAGVILMTASTFDVEADGFISLDAGTGSVQILANDNITISGATVDMLGTFSVNSVIIDPVGPLTGQALIYDGTKFAPATMSGDISGVTAGAGLIGGGSTGFLQLDVELTSNGGLTFSGAGDSGTLEVDYTSVADQLDGAGLVANGTTIDVNLGINSGLTFSGDTIIVDTNIAGNGLDITSGVLSVNTSEITSSLAGNGLTANGAALDVNVNTDSLEIVGDVVRLKDTVTGDRTFSGSINIGGNLTVSGTATYVNTENLYVEDNIITLNATFSGSPILDAGIEVNRGSGTYAVMYWDETNDYWKAGLSGSNNYVVTQAGTGLSQNFDTLSVDFTAVAENLQGNGLSASGGDLNIIGGTGIGVDADGVYVDFTSVATNLQGNGLTANGGVLDVNVDNGLQISGDYVKLGGTLSQNTTISGGVYDLTINNFDGTATSSVSISDSLVSISVLDGLTQSIMEAGSGYVQISSDSGSNTAMIELFSSDNSVPDGSTNNRLIVTDSANSKGLVYAQDYTANFTTYSLITKQYVDQQVLSAGTITQITAGSGLTGGGTGGNITLDVVAGDGIEIVGDAVSVNLVNTDSGLEFVAGELQVDLAGTSGLTLTGGLQIDSTAAGDGLSFASGVFDVNVANGLQIVADNVEVAPSIAGTGLTFSAGVLSVVAGSAQPVYQAATSTTQPLPLTNNYDTGITISSTPNDYSRVNVYVNGQLQRLGNGVTTTDCYFGTQSGVAVNITDIVSGYTLFWNGTNAGFRIASSDTIDIIYEA